MQYEFYLATSDISYKVTLVWYMHSGFYNGEFNLIQKKLTLFAGLINKYVWKF